MIWVLWSLLLVVQNAAFTWVSRARNSGSYFYHGIAAIFSNGVWFASQFILIGIVIKEIDNIGDGLLIGLLYIASTVTGSVTMHWLSTNYLEKGKRKVGG